MRRWFLRWLAPCLLVALCSLPAVHAQAPPDRISYDDMPASEQGERTPALQYFVATVSVIIVLVIVLTPSRKRHM